MEKIDGVLDKEHKELVERLEEASGKGTEAGRVFVDVLGIFRYHLEKENETIVPLLVFLKDRLDEKNQINTAELDEARHRFDDKYCEMIQEHRIMGNLLKKAETALITEEDERSSELIRELMHHVELEEELLYPAAKASGYILKVDETRAGPIPRDSLGAESTD